jgi:2,3-bisphosphoglycerate-dependent phosphoglycerate mutase
MSYLVLVRHGKSKWNDLGLWTGWSDIDLHQDGEIDAQNMANHIKGIEIHLAHTSLLKRAKKTAEIILESLQKTGVPIFEDGALNERSYGIHTGKNKWQVKEEVGDEEFNRIRRSWDHPIPEGETLQDVHARVVPYFEDKILPELKSGKNILIAAHGNSLRALTKHLCKLSEEEVCNLEIGLGEVHVYEFNNQGEIINQEVRGENQNKGQI